jgi:predicted esterase
MPSVLTIETGTHGRVLLDGTAALPAPVLIGFHGYAENAQQHFEQLQRIPGVDAWWRVAVQGLHRFYATKTQEVIASWMTREDRELAIADNVAYVDRVTALLTARHGHPSRLVFLGFSQGVAMAFRAAVLGASRSDGVIALGGDVPPDLLSQPASRFPKVLLARGTADPWYTEDKLHADVEQLRSKGIKVEVATFDGGHEWTDGFRLAASLFLTNL